MIRGSVIRRLLDFSSAGTCALLLSAVAACATTGAPRVTAARTGSGNPLTTKTAASEPTAEAPAAAARLNLGWPVWIGVVCDDLPAQRRFYRDVLGLREWDVGEGWIWFDLDGKLLELFARTSRPQYAQRGVAVGFLVDDIQAARATLIERGAQPVGATESDATSSWAYFRDADGTLFE
ncbi:MAG TPA: VOC family protein, partial [Polyangia bacterium]|nr:VOC family protein [Polyangia bacterium]